MNKYEEDFPFWAIEAYKTNERTFDIANAEYQEERSKGDKDDSLSLESGGDTDAFSNIEKQFGFKQSKAEKK